MRLRGVEAHLEDEGADAAVVAGRLDDICVPRHDVEADQAVQAAVSAGVEGDQLARGPIQDGDRGVEGITEVVEEVDADAVLERRSLDSLLDVVLRVGGAIGGEGGGVVQLDREHTRGGGGHAERSDLARCGDEAARQAVELGRIRNVSGLEGDLGRDGRRSGRWRDHARVDGQFERAIGRCRQEGEGTQLVGGHDVIGLAGLGEEADGSPSPSPSEPEGRCIRVVECDELAIAVERVDDIRVARLRESEVERIGRGMRHQVGRIDGDQPGRARPGSRRRRGPHRVPESPRIEPLPWSSVIPVGSANVSPISANSAT